MEVRWNPRAHSSPLQEWQEKYARHGARHHAAPEVPYPPEAETKVQAEESGL